MAEASKISWTDATFNPWRGCTKVAEECRNCYAETLSGRNPKSLGIWGPQGTRVVAAENSTSGWQAPVKWNRLAAQGKLPDGSPNPDGHRPRIFCASLADVFEEWPGQMVNTKGERLSMSHPSPSGPEWWYGEPDCAGGEPLVTMSHVRLRLFRLIRATPGLVYMLLTKRPENIRPMIATTVGLDWWKANCAANVWLGTTAGLQETADANVPKLLECSDLSPCLWVSCEPMLGPVDFTKWLNISGDAEPRWHCRCGTCNIPAYLWACDSCRQIRPDRLRWIITGGESGPGARPCNPDWVRSIRDQCQAAGVSFHHKQFSQADMKGFKDFDAFPDDLKIREFPEVQHA
jgi:protein gp37